MALSAKSCIRAAVTFAPSMLALCFIVIAGQTQNVMTPYQDWAGPRKNIFFAGVELDTTFAYAIVWVIVILNNALGIAVLQYLMHHVEDFAQAKVNKEDFEDKNDVAYMEQVEMFNISMRVFYNFAGIEFFVADLILKLVVPWGMHIMHSGSKYQDEPGSNVKLLATNFHS